MRMFKEMSKDEYLRLRARLVEEKEKAVEEGRRVDAQNLATWIDNLDFYQKGEVI